MNIFFAQKVVIIVPKTLYLSRYMEASSLSAQNLYVQVKPLCLNLRMEKNIKIEQAAKKGQETTEQGQDWGVFSTLFGTFLIEIALNSARLQNAPAHQCAVNNC